MALRPKTSYHPYLVVAFYLNCLPEELTQQIPRSTRHGWLHKEQSTLYGYDWYTQNQHTFDALKQIVTHKRLPQINKALLRILALQRFIKVHSHRIKEDIHSINQVVLNNLNRASHILSLRTTLKFLQLPYSSYLRMRRGNRCPSSVFSLCPGILFNYCSRREMP